MITSAELSELEGLAGKATPGPWRLEGKGQLAVVMAEDALQIVSTSWHSVHRKHYPLQEESVNNAAFIAALNPEVVLRIIGRVRELEGANASLRHEVRALKETAYGED